MQTAKCLPEISSKHLMGVIGRVIGLMTPENMYFIMGGCDGVNVSA